jgi:catechol 2,3-dioxygenase-like lactoylglutathione lyase family enzyme
MTMNLRITEIKAFVPAKDFEVSKQFYRGLGFTMASESGGVAYFHFGHVSFLLQDLCAAGLAENFMMHILVEDVGAWWRHVQASCGCRLTAFFNVAALKNAS